MKTSISLTFFLVVLAVLHAAANPVERIRRKSQDKDGVLQGDDTLAEEEIKKPHPDKLYENPSRSPRQAKPEVVTTTTAPTTPCPEGL